MRTPKANVLRVLLVDDHEVIRVGLRTVLSQNHGLAVVGEAATMADAIEQAQKLCPDLVLMDVRLPDGSGVDACREILANRSDTKVIFLTSYSNDDSLLAAVLAGAQGYVLKEINTVALIDAIKRVANGQSILDSAVTDRALAWIRGFKNGNQVIGTERLSPQEERVVMLVAEGRTNKEIAVALKLSDKTVKNYLANVFQKLRITRRTQAAAFYHRQEV